MISCFMSMGLSRQEYWSELPCPPSGDLPDSGTELVSAWVSCTAGRFFTHWATWKAQEIKYLPNSLLFSLPHWHVSSRRAGPLSAALPASRMQHPAQSEYSINIYSTGEFPPLPCSPLPVTHIHICFLSHRPVYPTCQASKGIVSTDSGTWAVPFSYESLGLLSSILLPFFPSLTPAPSFTPLPDPEPSTPEKVIKSIWSMSSSDLLTRKMHRLSSPKKPHL